MIPRLPGTARARGFTLLEVMVALAILAGGMLAVSDVVGGAMRNHARAIQLDVATLLARGKLAEVEDHYEEEGFKDFDETTDGKFDEEGHPEIAWKLEVVKPEVDLGTAANCDALLGKDGMSKLLGQQSQPSGGGPTAGPSPIAAMMEPLVRQQCTSFGETLKSKLREVRLTVSWPGGAKGESFTVVTHLVVLQPRKGQP